VYSLGSRLLKGDIFELDHMKYKEYHPLVNDGPDIVEMMDAMELAKQYLKRSLTECNNSSEQKRLLEDKERFEYGYAMYRFIFHMVRTSIFHKEGDKNMAAREFLIAEKYAEQLNGMDDVVQVASGHTNSSNGFTATGMEKVFDKFKDLYSK
jgi:hypothetical protein